MQDAMSKYRIAKYYAVRRGWFRGVFLHQPTAERATRNHPDPKMQRFFNRSSADKYVYGRRVDEAPRLIVYTDGSYRHRYDSAGYGVFFGDDDDRNTGGTMAGTCLSSQKAECYAAVVALLLTAGDVEVRTDSLQLVLRATVKYSHPYNAESSMYKAIRALSKNRTVLWTYVKSHAGYYGNEHADTLARRGSMVRRVTYKGLHGVMTYRDVLCSGMDRHSFV